jgi:hypothetical protein
MRNASTAAFHTILDHMTASTFNQTAANRITFSQIDIILHEFPFPLIIPNHFVECLTLSGIELASGGFAGPDLRLVINVPSCTAIKHLIFYSKGPIAPLGIASALKACVRSSTGILPVSYMGVSPMKKTI